VTAAIRRALDIKGIHDPAARARWERGMDMVARRESNYNANAVNGWDSNAAAGTPSKGAWQFIEPTFERYREPGTSRNIHDLLSQAAAFINYAQHHYHVRADGSNLADRIQQADPRRSPKGY
jgi:SLT domain-containing protein